MGARWGCLCQDRPPRFLVAWSLAAREEEAAPAGIAPTRPRTREQAGCAWVSEGHRIDLGEMARVYRDPQRTGKRGRPRRLPPPGVQLSQAIQRREGGRVVGVKARATIGVLVACPYAVCEERLHGVLRDRLGCLTRPTHAVAKRVGTWEAAVGLCWLEQNGLRAHPALRRAASHLPGGRRYERRTPAMAQGLTDHVWSWSEFLTHPVHQCRRE